MKGREDFEAARRTLVSLVHNISVLVEWEQRAVSQNNSPCSPISYVAWISSIIT
jgi:hypothetical protein